MTASGPAPRASVISVALISPLGEGGLDTLAPEVGQPARVAIERDAEMEQRGFVRPFCARVRAETLPADQDRAGALLERPLLRVCAELGQHFSGARIGLVLGTSSGGMRSAEELFELRARGEEPPRELAHRATYFAPFQGAKRVLAEHGFELSRALQLVTACAASTWALGLGLRWLETDEVDLVLAGGYDALGPFVASGFECLRATSASRPAPFRVGRDGMALGEGAGLVAMVREGEERGLSRAFFVSGFGQSTDAVHITAPDRSGGGLLRAARAALEDAALAPGECPIVSAHATSTPFNDAMESKAIQQLFGATPPLVQPFKAQIGHTLGAAGVLEALALAAAIERGVAPPAAGDGELDVEAPARLLARGEPCDLPAGLKLSAAFGGANAALVLERADQPSRRLPRPRRKVYLRAFAAAGRPDAQAVAHAAALELDKVARADAMSLLLATAIASLSGPGAVCSLPFDLARLEGAGIIVSHALATIDINARFYARVLARGPAFAEPRVFPPTSPNLVAGQVAIFFRLTGPGAALASGPGGGLDALRVAHDLVAAGDADRVVAAAVDVVGEASRDVLATAFSEHELQDGAVAAVLDCDREGAVAEVTLPESGQAFGHLALVGALEGLSRVTLPNWQR